MGTQPVKLKKLSIFAFTLAMLAAMLVLPSGAIDFDAEETYNAVFVVYSGDSLGSGFAIGENCVVTNAHVIGDPDDVALRTYSGDTYTAGIVAMDEGLDIAVLQVDGVTFPYLAVGDLSSMGVGDDVYAVGAPNSLAYTLTKGIISALNRQVGGYTYIQIDAALNSGNSGGPLLDSAGEVIGVNTLKLSDSEGIGMSIPITAVCEYLEAQGIALTGSGNVAGPVYSVEASPASTAPVSAETDGNSETAAAEHGDITVPILLSLLGLSFSLNVVLIVRAVYQRRKETVSQSISMAVTLPNQMKTAPPDPRDRTDFDIDLWE